MQKTLSRTIECKKCGCISFPDATICPKCGARYDKKLNVTDCIDIFTISDDLTVSEFNEVDKLIWCSHYQFTCPVHGSINIEASVISPAIKCPFCRI